MIAGGSGKSFGANVDGRGIGSLLGPCWAGVHLATLYKGAGVPLFFL